MQLSNSRKAFVPAGGSFSKSAQLSAYARQTLKMAFSSLQFVSTGGPTLVRMQANVMAGKGTRSRVVPKAANSGRGTNPGGLDGIESDLVDAFLDGHGELGDGVAIGDSGGVVFANEALARMLGVRPGDVLKANSFSDFLAEDERGRVATRQRVRLRSAQGIDAGETVFVRRDGTTFPAAYVARRVGTGQKASVLWLVHDKSGEDWTQEELQLSETRFATFAAAVGDAVIYLDEARETIVDASSGAEKLFARKRSDIVGADWAQLLDGIELGEIDEEAAPAPFEAVAKPGKGDAFPVEVSLVRLPFRDAPRVALLVRDIRLRKESEEKRQKAIDDLRRLNAARTEFINMAAHELRTPLAPMKAETALLKTSSPDELGNEQRKSVDALARNLERLSTFVDDLLEVARMQAGKIELKRQRIDLGKLVATTANLFETAAQYSDVTVKVVSPKECFVTVDRARIEQVVFNLISNALKFTGRGGTVTLSVATSREGDVVVEVKDTGIGIPKEDQAKLFQPFGQIDKAHQKRQKGAGLGLFICKTLVEMHEGKVWVKSAGPGKGATFGFSVPTS